MKHIKVEFVKFFNIIGDLNLRKESNAPLLTNSLIQLNLS